MLGVVVASGRSRLLWPQWQGAGTASVRELAPEFPFAVARRGYAVGSAATGSGPAAARRSHGRRAGRHVRRRPGRTRRRRGQDDRLQGDLRSPEAILADADVRQLIDFSQPLAVLILAVLHFVSDADRPYEAVRTIVDALPSGSYLVLSQSTPDEVPHDVTMAMKDAYSGASAQVFPRSSEEIAQFFDGLELVDPRPGERHALAVRPAVRHPAAVLDVRRGGPEALSHRPPFPARPAAGPPGSRPGRRRSPRAGWRWRCRRVRRRSGR